MIGARRTGCRTLALVLLWTVSLPVSAEVAFAANPGFATLEAVGGEVVVVRQGQTLALSPSLPLQLDDVVVTKRGRATVRFHSDGTVLRVGPDSRVQVNETATERGITVFFGRVWAHVVRWRERPTRFESGSTIAAIRGTELAFAVEGDETQIAVLEGQVQAQTDAGQLALSGGQVAVGRKGKAPALVTQVRPKDAVRWALYYLPVVQVSAGDLGDGQGWRARLRESVDANHKGDLERALAALDGVAENDVRDSRFFSYRASLLLATGSVDAATKDIDRALRLSANDADALSLQAIVAVVDNEPDKALEAARRAVAADSRSATARVAQAYARQARFDLDGARESLESAVKLAPADALAWARLAEIRSSQGLRDEALAAAQKASSLDPNLARTQSVLGFAYLAEVKTHEAREAFTKASALDSSDPLARLGLGLARIREGALDEGSRELEVAVSLDPGQSILRSYLGKAYYEGKRERLVEREFDLARQSDPKDPTPWLYDAIFKQTTNRPVEALQSLQQAIALNDNRAVYRSRLLLDSDLAARSASLGRVYSDLGFENLALVEGWSSVNTDPGNYSAHRLLADSYSALPRHEIARVSELLQSQLLQPLNTTPIQPSLGESSLFLLSAQGPSALSFNEFNPLFNRNQLNVQGSFQAAQDNTWAGEGIASGIYGKASFSVGYSGFKTDGFRTNAMQDDRIANAFAQVELSPTTSVQAELRHRKLETGDVELRYFENDFSPLQSETDKATNERFGLRHDFSPSLTLLASYMHQDKDIAFALPDPVAGFDFGLGRNEKANSEEAQLLYRSGRVKLIAGAGRFDVHSTESNALGGDLAGFTQLTDADTKIGHTNLYAYSHFALPGNVTLTAGVSGDLFDETGTATTSTAIPGVPPDSPVPTPAAVLGKRDQLNPKLGISWTSMSGTTLRAAGFRTLKRTLVTDQTLEPTQVAGFNQFYDDASATRSWVYGGAIDQKLGKKAFAGFEFTGRELTIPQLLFPDGQPPVLEQRDGKERLARAYLFATPHAWLALGAEYEYEKFELDPQLFFAFRTVKTQRVPLSARFFHPSGLSALLSATYLTQDGEFKAPGGNDFAPGSRDFWVFDAAVRYRLPKRYGFVAIGVNNFTDEKSTYQATDSRNLRIRPGRSAYARVVLALP
jgi:tetratricopeptide (TPR) repeat protein